MKLGSHNSWTFAPKAKWWFPAFTARCQSKNIQKQYKAGVRLFDLRLQLKGAVWCVAHGYCVFHANWKNDILWLSQQEEKVYVRVFLEYNRKPQNEETIINKFSDLCAYLEHRFETIKFFGGILKYNGRRVHNFINTDIPQIEGRISSDTSLFKSDNRFLAILDDLWPWLYAFLYNKKSYANHDTNKYLFLDFI